MFTKRIALIFGGKNTEIIMHKYMDSYKYFSSKNSFFINKEQFNFYSKIDSNFNLNLAEKNISNIINLIKNYCTYDFTLLYKILYHEEEKITYSNFFLYNCYVIQLSYFKKNNLYGTTSFICNEFNFKEKIILELEKLYHIALFIQKIPEENNLNNSYFYNCKYIFSPFSSGFLAHEIFGHALEADNLIKNKDLLNTIQRIQLSNKITVIDDGNICNFGYMPIDDEENINTKSYLIKKGGFCNLLNTNSTYNYLNIYTHGNARTSMNSLVSIPRMTNTYVENGNENICNLFNNNDEYIYFMYPESGVHTFQHATIKFSLAIYFKQGYPNKILRNFYLKNIFFDLFNRIEDVYNDCTIYPILEGCTKQNQNFLNVSVGGPHIKLFSRKEYNSYVH